MEPESTDKPERKVTYTCDLSPEDVVRFSRQLVLPEFGVKGQISVREKSFLVVGAGGLGCSAGIHLAGSGAGKITILDHDKIEASNLHRQILYSSSDIGKFKASVLAEKCARLNPNSRAEPASVCELLTVDNAVLFVKNHDIILDCTDNVYARYLLNDACVLEGKPLVSASALKFDGQLTVYNYNGSPCRRCIFPDGKIMQAQSCDDNGVMGPVPGIMGSLQAMEAIKLASGIPVSFAGVTLHYNALSGTFHRIKLRPRNNACPICGSESIITKVHDDHLGTNTCIFRPPDVPTDKLLSSGDRITVEKLNEKLERGDPVLIIDVRSPAEIDICGFRNGINVPIDSLYDELAHPDIREKFRSILSDSSSTSAKELTVVCRRGNDSQIAVHILRSILADLPIEIKDLTGGLYNWNKEVDAQFPTY